MQSEEERVAPEEGYVSVETPTSELQRVVSLIRQAHYATDAEIAALAAETFFAGKARKIRSQGL